MSGGASKCQPLHQYHIISWAARPLGGAQNLSGTRVCQGAAREDSCPPDIS